MSSGKSAAFFDLDRTLMAGSSGFHWARAAYRAGLVSRRRLLQRAAGGFARVQDVHFHLGSLVDAEHGVVVEV